MYYNEIRIPEAEVANCFAAFFVEKVDKIVNSATIDDKCKEIITSRLKKCSLLLEFSLLTWNS